MNHQDSPQSFAEGMPWQEEFEKINAGRDFEVIILDSQKPLGPQIMASLTDEQRADLEQYWEYRMLREIEAEMGGGKASDQDRYRDLVLGLRWLLIRAVQEHFPVAQALAIERQFIDPLTTDMAEGTEASSGVCVVYCFGENGCSGPITGALDSTLSRMGR
jgi:hypothetical protein